jgi:chemotaxis protein histidine kinase CheA
MYSGGFSLIKFFFGDDDKKKDKNDDVKKKATKKKNEKLNESYQKSNTVDSTKKAKNTFNEKQKKLIKKLEIAFDNYLYRKKVKNLIQMQKDNYMIVCTANIPNLYLNIIRNKKVKQYKLTYDPILKLNVAFLPRKVYRNKKQLKFIFANLKKEIFFEPLYKTEYEDGGFINVLDLQEIKEKESNDEENFQNFLKNYYKNKNNKDNKDNKDNNDNKDNEDNKDKSLQKIKVNIKEFGDLVNTASPVHIKTGSMVQDLISKIYKLDGEKESIKIFGSALMNAGVKLLPAYSGTGFNENTRVFSDFSARVYYMEAEHIGD